MGVVCGSFSLFTSSEVSSSSPALCQWKYFYKETVQQNFNIKGMCRETNTTLESCKVSIASLLGSRVYLWSIMVFIHGPWRVPTWCGQSHKPVKLTHTCLLEEESQCTKGESPPGYQGDVSMLAKANKWSLLEKCSLVTYRGAYAFLYVQIVTSISEEKVTTGV